MHRGGPRKFELDPVWAVPRSQDDLSCAWLTGILRDSEATAAAMGPQGFVSRVMLRRADDLPKGKTGAQFVRLALQYNQLPVQSAPPPPAVIVKLSTRHQITGSNREKDDQTMGQFCPRFYPPCKRARGAARTVGTEGYARLREGGGVGMSRCAHARSSAVFVDYLGVWSWRLAAEQKQACFFNQKALTRHFSVCEFFDSYQYNFTITCFEMFITAVNMKRYGRII